MPERYPALEPGASGELAVGDANVLHWETCGNPEGKPAVVLHGGPGSGCSPLSGRLFDPERYRIVLFDQRNCGRSTPHASDPTTDLEHNTTQHLVADIEQLRVHLGIDRWLVLGGSWGSTLALAYAESHPERVSEMVLFAVTTGRWTELDWTFRGGLGRLFPEQWERLETTVAGMRSAGDVVTIVNELLSDPDRAVRERAAEAWCLWESSTPDWPPTTGLAERYRDPRFAVAFARIVTHYVRHNLWLEDGLLLENAGVLAETPGVLINARLDLQSPLESAWALKRAWPRAELVVVDGGGHGLTADVVGEIVRATNRLAVSG